MKQLIYKRAAFITITWTLVIFTLCAIPGPYIPSNDWLDMLSVDKLVHAFMFFTLTVMIFVCSRKYQYGKGTTVVLFFLSLSYGVLLEIMQATLFSHRSADWKDAVADMAGCFIALTFFKKIRNVVSILERC